MLVEINTGPAVLQVVKVLKETLHLPLKDAYDLIHNEKSYKQEYGRIAQFECPNDKFEELKTVIQTCTTGRLYKIV